MIDRVKLLDLLLDNQELSDEDLILLIEKNISKGLPYNHTLSTPREACGIHTKDRDTKVLSKSFDTVSEEIESIEKTFTKREIAFMFSIANRRLRDLKKDMDKLEVLIARLGESGKSKS